MADVFEALCGALCMDKGWQAAERFILSTLPTAAQALLLSACRLVYVITMRMPAKMCTEVKLQLDIGLKCTPQTFPTRPFALQSAYWMHR